MMLETVVKRNLKRSVVEECNAFDDHQFRTFIRQLLRRSRTANDTDDSSVDLPSNSEDDEFLEAGERSRLSRPLECHPQ